MSDAAREGMSDLLAGAGYHDWLQSQWGSSSLAYFGPLGARTPPSNVANVDTPKHPPQDPGTTAGQTGEQSTLSKVKDAVCAMIPDGRIVGVGGGFGLLGGGTGSLSHLINYNTGESSAFATGGGHAGSNGGLNVNIQAGLVFGLGSDNRNFSGPFAGFDASDGPLGFSAQTSGTGTRVVTASIGLSLLPVFWGIADVDQPAAQYPPESPGLDGLHLYGGQNRLQVRGFRQ
jgi:hypothetical protein